MVILRNTLQKALQAAPLLSFCLGSLYAEEGLPNPSIRPQAQARTVSVSADALYWYTAENVDWAFTLTNRPNFERSEFKSFVFDWAPGFRIGLGYNMQHDQWDTQASYTWFQSKATDHVKGASVTPAFLGARLSLLEPFSTGKASLNLHYNMFDWDLGRSFLVGKHLIFRPYIGLKGGWIDQTLHSYWTIPHFIGPFGFSASETLKQRFRAGGPKGGILGKWCFGNIEKHYFSAMGLFEAGCLWGHWSIKDKFVDSLETVIRIEPSRRNFGSFMLHAFAGFGWDYTFDRNRSHFSVKLGYEIEDWFNQFQIYSDSSGAQNNDLILQGLNGGIRLDF